MQKFILCVKTVSSQAQTKGSEFVLLRDQPFDLVVHGGRVCVCWGVQGEGGKVWKNVFCVQYLFSWSIFGKKLFFFCFSIHQFVSVQFSFYLVQFCKKKQPVFCSYSEHVLAL